ncbi:MAG: mandelate racemase/muconate lactonizing enzyme family protein [Chloroflexota bacterium]
MKITQVETYLVFSGRRNWLFVTVDTDEGVWGVGESNLTSREEAVVGYINHLRPLLIGQDPSRIEYLWQVMSRSGFFPADRVGASAIGAIDTALWDVAGKALGVPVYQLLGGLTRERVVCYPHNAGENGEIEGLVESAHRTTALGYKFVRWGLPTQDDLFEPRQALRTTLRQCEALRTALGDEVELCLDVHTRLDPADAATLCREIEAYRPYFVEDPLRSEDTNAYRALRSRTGVPLAAGEQFAGKWEYRQLIEEDLIDYARIDPTLGGGLTESRKIAGWCETHHINIVPHNPNGPVSTAACLHLCLACSNVSVLELPQPTGTVLQDVFPVTPRFVDGYLLAPTQPGLGVEFDREAARRHPYQMTELPHLRRLDGAFTNW